MRWLISLLVVCCCVRARADERWSELGPIDDRDAEHFALSFEMRAGGARAPFFTRFFPAQTGHGLIFQLGGAYRVRDDLLLEARLPLVLLELSQPARSFVDQFSWGNADFQLSHRSTLAETSTSRLHLVRAVGLALPTAQQGPSGSLFGLRALQVANAMNALRHPELYTPGTIPLSPSAGVLYERASLGLEANLRVPLFVRISRAKLPHDADVRWFSLTPVLHFAARYTLTRWFEIALAADTVFNAYAPVKPTRDERTTQFSLDPSVGFHLREHWQLRADVLVPIAGALGGHAYAGALQLCFTR